MHHYNLCCDASMLLSQPLHVQVISKRQDAAPMQMRLSSDIDAQQGFTLDHGGYSRSQQEGDMKARRYFIPPCTIRFVPSPATHAMP